MWFEQNPLHRDGRRHPKSLQAPPYDFLTKEMVDVSTDNLKLSDLIIRL